MNPSELRASLSLAAVFALRMFGMFVVLPVLALWAQGRPGWTLTLVGIALGAYGLTQAVLQMPFGWLSDRYGRKPVIHVGLLLLAAGSLVCALAEGPATMILGRVIQGAGAISATVIALAADLTRESQRTKSMAIIGSSIGAAFALSFVAAPFLMGGIGIPGIFALYRRAGTRRHGGGAMGRSRRAAAGARHAAAPRGRALGARAAAPERRHLRPARGADGLVRGGADFPRARRAFRPRTTGRSTLARCSPVSR
jgi:MFS family permease